MDQPHRTAQLGTANSWAISLVALSLAVAVRLLLDPVLGTSFPFITVFGAVAMAVWAGGRLESITVAIVGYLAASCLFIEPRGGLAFGSAANFIGLLLYLATCAIIIGFGQAMRRARTLSRQALEVLRRSEERLRLAQGIARIGTFEWDIEANEYQWTDELAAMYGRTTADISGKGFVWHDVVHPDDRDEVIRKTVESMTTGQFEHEWRILWPDGSVHWVAGRGSAFFDKNGKPLRMLGINIDITERRNAEEALKQADRNKDQFLATLAHELRNPLAPVRNALDIMRLAGSDAAMLENARTLMERQVAHLVRLIDDLLDVSRITRDKLDLRRERLELASVVEQAAETSRPLFDQAGQTFEVSMPAEPMVLDGDAVRLAQVFGNLLTNASKYTGHGGTIAFEVRRDGNEAVAVVRDDGVGIPADKLPHVFEMFTQIDHSLVQSQGGLGIGLAIVQRLVGLHGGSVSATSAGPGRGSTFTVRLPLAEAATAQAQKQHEEVPLMEDSTRPARRILVVDDNEDAAMTLAMLLKMKGSETELAHDGLDAIEKAARFRPDVILLDIGLPKMDGYDACREIRKQPWGSAITMIALTGWGQDDDRRKSMEAGFDLHLVKPVAPAALMKMLGEAQ
ncbi:MAG TPA: ATP-binding protein [Candidatus Limnocylindrales bacterium]|nr:ATP-binding protein [Candidatus Limnocylindrales bacterium]